MQNNYSNSFQFIQDWKELEYINPKEAIRKGILKISMLQSITLYGDQPRTNPFQILVDMKNP